MYESELLTFILASLTISVEKKARSSQDSRFKIQEQRSENKFDLDKNVRVKIIYSSDILICVSQFAKRHRNLRITREIGSNQTSANQKWLILTNQLDKIY